MDDRILDLCSLIRRKYTSSASEMHPVDLARICSFFTLDVIFTVTFGESMGFLASDQDVHGYLANQKAMLPVFEWLSTLPSLERFVRWKWISRAVMPRPTDKTGVGLLMGFDELPHGSFFSADKETGLRNDLSRPDTREKRREETCWARSSSMVFHNAKQRWRLYYKCKW